MYSLLDSGNEEKLERFGDYTLVRPSSAAVWGPSDSKLWKSADAHFTRTPANKWANREKLPPTWKIELSGLTFKIEPSDFGHLGIFPEHEMHWQWMEKVLKGKKANVLNLFAYTGAATLAAARSGASVCHLDASKPMVDWARTNADLNHLADRPVRWIVDDVMKFLRREVRRNRKYDAIVLDPPTFGRGPNGELFKIEKEIGPLLELCKELLSDTPLFVLLTCHTPGYTPTVLQNLLSQNFSHGRIEAGETLIQSKISLPAGAFARWIA
ncbi:MAG: class I SAM-dependent methyltransferase [Candidatus Algichlamydia australiensis]|nr:class I SAM-dependent methyltransferase [Chlamydiales bacterium]